MVLRKKHLVPHSLAKLLNSGPIGPPASGLVTMQRSWQFEDGLYIHCIALHWTLQFFRLTAVEQTLECLGKIGKPCLVTTDFFHH